VQPIRRKFVEASEGSWSRKRESWSWSGRSHPVHFGEEIQVSRMVKDLEKDPFVLDQAGVGKLQKFENVKKELGTKSKMKTGTYLVMAEVVSTESLAERLVARSVNIVQEMALLLEKEIF